MRALVKESAGPGFELKDVPEPTIRDDEVLIRVRRAGVCGTDVHIYDWDDWAKGRCKPPFVVGHEFAGDVVRVGALVDNVKEGDRVTAEGHIVDGRCLLCRTGNAHVCPFTKIIGVDHHVAGQDWEQTQLAWINPSPNIRDEETALLAPIKDPEALGEDDARRGSRGMGLAFARYSNEAAYAAIVAEVESLKGLVDEFSRSIRQELDYRLEARNADTFHKNFAGHPHVHVWVNIRG